ncbi:MAG: hypothetical protein Q7U53_17345 [Anaerolineaceae bacterium]|nr:hypothetical protein [Anaerolineaceae bacterium]
MTQTITVETKAIGQTGLAVQNWEVFIEQLKIRYSLAELIRSIVQDEVNAANQGNQVNRLSQVMSFEEIEHAKAAGKIAISDKSRKTIVDPEKEIEKALKAFSRGVYYVFIDNNQINHLDEEVIINTGSKILFIRLTPLVGG